MNPTLRIRLAALVPAGLLLLGGAIHADPDSARRECELGITLALTGQSAAAESVFTSLLSRSPGDARARTNLGNLALLRGEARVALAFYVRARDSDSTDAGIALNEATVHLLLGDEERAVARAADGVRQAGGVRAAAGLLGLAYPDSVAVPPRGNPGPALSPEEMLILLRAAVAKVPADTTGATPRDSSLRGTAKRPTAWRSAGARAGAQPELATQLYWKR
jgi:hypothetical protein